MRTSGHIRARGIGSGVDEDERGGGRRPRPSGRARRAPARARHLDSGRGFGGTGCGPPEAGGSAHHRRRPNPGPGATPPGTAAGRPPRRTRGDTAWLVSRVSGDALCTGLRDGSATTERNARLIDRSPLAHARSVHNLAAGALPIDSRSVFVAQRDRVRPRNSQLI